MRRETSEGIFEIIDSASVVARGVPYEGYLLRMLYQKDSQTIPGKELEFGWEARMTPIRTPESHISTLDEDVPYAMVGIRFLNQETVLKQCECYAVEFHTPSLQQWSSHYHRTWKRFDAEEDARSAYADVCKNPTILLARDLS